MGIRETHDYSDMTRIPKSWALATEITREGWRILPLPIAKAMWDQYDFRVLGKYNRRDHEMLQIAIDIRAMGIYALALCTVRKKAGEWREGEVVISFPREVSKNVFNTHFSFHGKKINHSVLIRKT